MKDTRKKSECEPDNSSSSNDYSSSSNDYSSGNNDNAHENDHAKDHDKDHSHDLKHNEHIKHDEHDEHDEHDHEHIHEYEHEFENEIEFEPDHEHIHDHEHEHGGHHGLVKPFIWIYKDGQNLGNFFICINDYDTKNWLEFQPKQKMKAINSYELVKMDKREMSVVLRSKSKANYFVRLGKNKIEFGESVSELKELIRNSQQSLIGDWACFQSCTTLIQGRSIDSN
jgi:hypothetical protein